MRKSLSNERLSSGPDLDKVFDGQYVEPPKPFHLLKSVEDHASASDKFNEWLETCEIVEDKHLQVSDT